MNDNEPLDRTHHHALVERLNDMHAYFIVGLVGAVGASALGDAEALDGSIHHWS